MSLINQMLCDLEARRGGMPMAEQQVFAGLSAADPQAGANARPPARASLLWLLLLAITLLLVARVGRDGAPGFVEFGRAADPPSPAILSASATLPAVAAAVPLMPAAPAAIAAIAPTVAPAPALPELTDIAVLNEGETVTLKLTLSAPTQYSVQVDEQGQARMQLVNVRLREAYTQRFDPNDVIRGLSLTPAGEDAYAVAFTISDGTTYSHAMRAVQGNAYELTLRCETMVAVAESAPIEGAPSLAGSTVSPTARIPETPVEVAPAPATVHKTLHAPDGSVRDDALYAEALAALQGGDRHRAEAIVTDVLATAPEHVAARLLAVAILMEDQRLPEARSLLEAGLALLPGHTELSLAYGRLLAEQGDVNGAITQLTRAAPAPSADPQYHALIAALMQRAGRHTDAIVAYRQILSVQPRNGIWWLGLGISLAAAGQHNEAATAFNEALADPSLNENLRRYVSDRLSELSRAG